ncbi:lipopolysaccharide assembly LapA domain-containing protein [Mangrovibacterium marinum]|uniref:Putative integral membrane protein n=1 Tax=Mangrovibacterium marinum TaxID=1639118 RepID=A0A2T5BY91_9BACT|nr:LapA family protein [Mangrovibacterium marinum]PTN06791.1 putative integral membrane protein [Mangrovibacterium marinum]
MSAGIIILLVLALLLVIFTLQNSVAIDLKLLFWQLSDVPLVLTLVVCVITGFLIAALLNYPKIWSLKSKIKALQKELTELKAKQREAAEEDHPEGIEMKGGSDNDLFNV